MSTVRKDSSLQAFDAIIGESAAIRQAKRLALKVAESSIPTVLVAGETGTGKELFAHGIHHAGGGAAAPFVPVNCAALPENLLESELFGHERGAFTDARVQKKGLLELAGSGTIFLDEIGELRLPLQAKLLRVLEERSFRRIGGTEQLPVRCRIVVASNRRLEEEVARGQFREDLFYRINTFRVNVPALRERDDDIALLARHFVTLAAEQSGLSTRTLGEDALALLRQHSWPGNVRELRNVVGRAVVTTEDSVIDADEVLIQRRAWVHQSDGGSFAGEIPIPRQGKPLDEIVRDAIHITLTLTGGNRSEAARILGISRPTLLSKLRQSERGRNGRAVRPHPSAS